MNHREWLAGVDLDRDIMPSNYNYVNWNNAALKGNLNISSDSILVYGNIGIWMQAWAGLSAILRQQVSYMI